MTIRCDRCGGSHVGHRAELTGDVSGLFGDVSGLSGDVNERA